MIIYTTKEDEGVTMAVFTSNDIAFEVPLTDIAEDNIQEYLQEQVDIAIEVMEIESQSQIGE